ncbi:DUF1707 SHOCT-like domain-containing protein [Brevibacterium sp. UCMA 11752]|uniref:DUF1707 SHOCT-like domain-containing protein n=1 Tax=Brevibacterium sp. UCMA 11752 TaxID=2745946 RepID=UPI001F29B2F8|nr:DUF1707 domain-containing protein [Brevibacterium sp. UCMA 11752]MCF2587009.1 DUF1707 domain-containing protein [Brevibacterium sp. UCMA 11752]
MNSSPLWSRFSVDPRAHGQVRASDADRAVVTDVLSEAFALGQIDAEEFDERSEAANRLKTLGEVPDLVQDLIIAEAGEVAPGELDDSARAQALARLNTDRIPITPEQIDAAAQKYYKDRVRNALLGMFAGPVGVTLAIWAATSFATGRFIFFWPIFVILPMLFGAISQISNKQSLIRDRKRELTKRARAQLGDAEAKRELEEHKNVDEDEDYEDTFGNGLQPPHPLAPPFAPGGMSPSDEMRRRRRERRHRRRNPWD